MQLRSVLIKTVWFLMVDILYKADLDPDSDLQKKRTPEL